MLLMSQRQREALGSPSVAADPDADPAVEAADATGAYIPYEQAIEDHTEFPRHR